VILPFLVFPACSPCNVVRDKLARLTELKFSGRESANGQDMDFADPECQVAATKIQVQILSNLLFPCLLKGRVS
jgi:hypothetical protein